MAEKDNHPGEAIRVDEAPEESRQQSEISLRSVIALAAAFLALFATVGFLNAYGVFQQYYTEKFLQDKTEFQISWIGSFSTFMFFVAAVPAGFLNDRYGPRAPAGVGAVCEIVALFMTSLCRKYYQFFLAQGVLLGLGMSFVSVPAAAMVPLYFPRNRGAAQGIAVAGSSLGGVIWPITLDQLLNSDGVSFGWTLRIVGFISIALLCLVLAGIERPRNMPLKRSLAAKSEEAHSTPSDEPVKTPKSDLARLRHPSFIFLCVGLALAYFGFFVPFFFVSTYAVQLGMSESFSFYLISILNAASLFGRILPGFVADRFGHFNILTVAMFGSGIVVFCWTTASSTAGLVVWALAYGFISGAILSLQFACASLVATKETMGTAIGILMGSIALTALFGTPIAGELVTKGFLALSMYAGAMLFVGGVFMALSRFARDRNLFAKV